MGYSTVSFCNSLPYGGTTLSDKHIEIFPGVPQGIKRREVNHLKTKHMKNEFTKLAQSNPTLRHDPFVQSMVRKEKRQAESDRIHLMSQLPSRSGWITLLQNRVNLNSVGNLRYQTRVYYDRRIRMVGPSESECNVPFRMAKLKNNQPSAGWIEA